MQDNKRAWHHSNLYPSGDGARYVVANFDEDVAIIVDDRDLQTVRTIITGWRPGSQKALSNTPWSVALYLVDVHTVGAKLSLLELQSVRDRMTARRAETEAHERSVDHAAGFAILALISPPEHEGEEPEPTAAAADTEPEPMPEPEPQPELEPEQELASSSVPVVDADMDADSMPSMTDEESEPEAVEAAQLNTVSSNEAFYRRLEFEADPLRHATAAEQQQLALIKRMSVALSKDKTQSGCHHRQRLRGAARAGRRRQSRARGADPGAVRSGAGGGGGGQVRGAELAGRGAGDVGACARSRSGERACWRRRQEA